ncbi:MAG: hypothetical protein ACK5RL_18655 [Acidimicrobiales bacterium]
MTDDHHDLDELASAVLDDEATAGERLRAETDPDLRSRLTWLGGAGVGVAAEPGPAPYPQRREHDLAAALDAFDALGLSDPAPTAWIAAGLAPDEPMVSAPPPPGTVADDPVDLAVRRDRRAARSRSSRWLGLAAGVAIVVGGSWAAVSALESSGGSDMMAAETEGAGGAESSATLSQSAPEAGDDNPAGDSAASDNAAEAAESDASAGTAGTTAATAVPPDGDPLVTATWPTDRELEAAAQHRIPADESACSTEVVIEPGEVAVAVIPLLAGGETGEAVVLQTAGGVERFVVVDGSCRPV